MILYPAIDIRGGKAVRLVEGDFARETPFDADPVEAALRWEAAGATWIHLVDLDGARGGSPVNTEVIQRIRASVRTKLQLGGGLRTLDHMARAFDNGLDRLVLGSIALSSPSLVVAAVARWERRIAVGLDAREGKLAANGWIEQTNVNAVDVAQWFETAGVGTFVFTDIGRDGRLEGPNLVALSTLIESVRADVIASGGVASMADLDAIRALGAAGAIVGRALYDGAVDLRTALARTQEHAA